MSNPANSANIDCLRPLMRGYSDDAFERLAALSQLATLPSNTLLFAPGETCKQAFIVVSGNARVEVVADSGREVILYRVQPGETCLMTTACLSSDKNYSAYGITETEVEAVIIPRAAFLSLLGNCEEFRGFIFGSYGNRFADIMVFIEEVLFQRLDKRLAAFLLKHAGADGMVENTHQAIATELGSAREVLSRELKSFERSGLVRLHRGRVEVIDRGRLSAH